MNGEFIVTSWFEPFSIKNFNLQMECTGGSDAREIDVLAWDNTGGWFALGNVAIAIGNNATEKFLE